MMNMKTTTTKLILLTSLLFVIFCNFTFYRHVTDIYPLTQKNIGFLISLPIGLTAFIVLILSLLSSKYTTKPSLILLLLMTSITAYFMDVYNVVIDQTMIQNTVQTNFDETFDLISPKLCLYFILLGIAPSLIVYMVQIEPVSWKRSLFIKCRNVIVSLSVILAIFLSFSKFYTSFIREHKRLRYYANPTYYVYSVGKYLNQSLLETDIIVRPLGEDAIIPDSDLDRELIILVIGEAARADHFSLNGYGRETNPLLQQEDVISFTNMYSCGTSTSDSVPCMFSIYPRAKYSNKKGASTQNLLDVLAHAGIHVLWRDNNSSSKGVANRVQYQNYKVPENNPICDIECRDEGMLVGLQEYIDEQKTGDIMIVLHQMGNHGPAYYKRYPASFEKFTPVCLTNELEECSEEEINNAYDNALLYTDYFLSKVIALLKDYSNRFETAMLYVSDHGESLGEFRVYLHGLPYKIAPEEQKHIAAVFWFGDSFKIDKEALRRKSSEFFSHDNLFHTILGLMEVETDTYDKSLDMINQ